MGLRNSSGMIKWRNRLDGLNGLILLLYLVVFKLLGLRFCGAGVVRGLGPWSHVSWGSGSLLSHCWCGSVLLLVGFKVHDFFVAQSDRWLGCT